MIQVGPYLTIDPARVSSMELDPAPYGRTTLAIYMADGKVHRVEHTRTPLGGVDVYRVRDEIIAATKSVST